MDWLLDFLRSICRPIGQWLGLPTKTVGFIGLGLIALVIIIIIWACAAHSKKKKKKAAAIAAKSASADEKKATEIAGKKADETAPVKAEKLPEEPAAVEEPAAEEQPAAVEETAEEVVPQEEKKTEEITAEETSAPEEVKEETPVSAETKEEVKEEKPAAAKEAKPKKPAAKKSAPKAKKASGKWVIEIKREGEYIAKLLASNGEVILNSETYSTAEGAKNGIATIIKGVENGNFIIYNTKGGEFYFKLKSLANKLLCAGEIYTTKDGCIAATESVKRFARDAVITDEVSEGSRYVDYTPAETEYEVKKGARGKWKIEQGENGGFCARLYANNGQLMLSTEEVKEKKTAEKGIENVKKNAAAGNFIIDKDKFGRFYYKLRNAAKSVICIGEGYDTVEGCISALESVRKFSATAAVVKAGTAETAKPE